ncbi:MAG: DUF2237 family protein [Sandaracinaceae bacterium]
MTDPTATDRQQNVLLEPLESCSMDPITGWFRDGCCNTDGRDHGSHTVCALMTTEFLAFSKAAGNDLSTPRPEYGFAGLNPGDRWCLCAARWQEAYEGGAAPHVVLAANNARALEIVDLSALTEHAIDPVAIA